MRGQIHVPDSHQMWSHKTPGRPSTNRDASKWKYKHCVQCNVQWQAAIQTALSQLYKDTARLTDHVNVSCPSPRHPPSTHQNWAKAGRTQCGYVNWHGRTKSVKHSYFILGGLNATCFNLSRRHLQAHKTPKKVPYKLHNATSHHPYVKIVFPLQAKCCLEGV